MSWILSMWKWFWRLKNIVTLSVLHVFLPRNPLGQGHDDVDDHTVIVTPDIETLYETPNFIFVNKKYDILINNVDKSIVTVETQLKLIYPDLINNGLQFSFYFTGRLDYSTSGILCIAKHKKACAQANDAFSARATQKFYLAIVRGLLSQDFLIVTEPIGEDIREQFSNTRMACKSMRHCSEKTRAAKTFIQVLERGMCYSYPATKILMKPITGRRHQLRLHCNFIGHTIVGDFVYSQKRDTNPHRMFLHSHKLEFPTKLESVSTVAPDPFIPEDENNHWIPLQKVKSVEEAELSLKELSK